MAVAYFMWHTGSCIQPRLKNVVILNPEVPHEYASIKLHYST